MAVILFIEDEVTYRTCLSMELEKAGHTVVLADNGNDASKMIAQWTTNLPDIIITDHRMPGMSGYELVKILRGREAFHTTPIVVLTAVVEQVKSLEQEEHVVVIDKITRIADVLAAIAQIAEKIPKKVQAPEKPLEIKRNFY